MQFDGKQAVGGGEVASRTDTIEFGQEAALIIMVADMFDDGIGIGDSEGVVDERKSPSVAFDGGYQRVALFESGEVAQTNSGNFFRVGIKFFQIVIGG